MRFIIYATMLIINHGIVYDKRHPGATLERWKYYQNAQKRLKNAQITNLGHAYHKHVGSVANAPKR